MIRSDPPDLLREAGRLSMPAASFTLDGFLGSAAVGRRVEFQRLRSGRGCDRVYEESRRTEDRHVAVPRGRATVARHATCTRRERPASGGPRPVWWFAHAARRIGPRCGGSLRHGCTKQARPVGVDSLNFAGDSLNLGGYGSDSFSPVVTAFLSA
jgi:hypothetical protein